MRQEVSIGRDSVGRNPDHVASDGGDDFQEQLGIGRARSWGEVSAAVPEVGGISRRARRDEHAPLNIGLRNRSQTIDSERHARRDIEAQIEYNDRVCNDDDNRDD